MANKEKKFEIKLMCPVCREVISTTGVYNTIKIYCRMNTNERVVYLNKKYNHKCRG